MTLWYGTTSTPIGPLTVAAESDGTVRATGFGDGPEALKLAPSDAARLRRDPLGEVCGRIDDYFDGKIMVIDDIPVRQPGTPTFQTAWRALRSIVAGTPVSYSDLAARSGVPRAVRAAASACARNAIPLIIPCHRVVRIGGALGGYGCGLERKRYLLDHEHRHGAGVLSLP